MLTRRRFLGFLGGALGAACCPAAVSGKVWVEGPTAPAAIDWDAFLAESIRRFQEELYRQIFTNNFVFQTLMKNTISGSEQGESIVLPIRYGLDGLDKMLNEEPVRYGQGIPTERQAR